MQESIQRYSDLVFLHATEAAFFSRCHYRFLGRRMLVDQVDQTHAAEQGMRQKAEPPQVMITQQGA